MRNVHTSCHIEFLPPNDSLSAALQQERERLIGRVVETFFVDLSVAYPRALMSDIHREQLDRREAE